jgi:hypothetical protein
MFWRGVLNYDAAYLAFDGQRSFNEQRAGMQQLLAPASGETCDSQRAIMSRIEQAGLARAFRARHHTRPILLLPNVWDGLSARLFVTAGFDTLATTSAGVAWALGYPDGEIAPWAEIVAATRRIVRVAGAPVTADIEAGTAQRRSRWRRTWPGSSTQASLESTWRIAPMGVCVLSMMRSRGFRLPGKQMTKAAYQQSSMLDAMLFSSGTVTCLADSRSR